MSLFEDMPSFSPVQFFSLACECPFVKGAFRAEKKNLLPSAADLLDEESFADVYVGWSEERLAFVVEVNQPFQKVGEGDFRSGDSIELFIDTRDLKTRSSVSKSCHHFVFFPVQVQNFYGREVTRFRSDDMHPLCHPEDLQVTADLGKNSYSLSIEIPAYCLHGFDPLFERLGFTYRINRADGPPQHFAVSSEEYAIEQHPASWGTLKLVKEE